MLKQVKSQSNELKARMLMSNPEHFPISLGCSACLHRDDCGGLAVERGLFDCTDLCCGQPSRCSTVCPTSASRFAAQSREVGGFQLNNVPRALPRSFSSESDVVPMVYHGSRRAEPFRSPMVALRLRDLVDYRRGRARFSSREQLGEFFKIDPTSRLIVSGVDHDDRIEPWWELGEERLTILRDLALVGVDLVTPPNFSLILDRPRFDDMHAMKRIAICFAEMQAAGIATALHPNGRTERDFERWGRFLTERPEITQLAYEFITGSGLNSRRDWHVDRLTALSKQCGRSLDIIVRGEPDVVPLLLPHFRSVIYIETTAFMKTCMRKAAVRAGNRGIAWSDAFTAIGDPLDRILRHNADEVRSHVRASYFGDVPNQAAA